MEFIPEDTLTLSFNDDMVKRCQERGIVLTKDLFDKVIEQIDGFDQKTLTFVKDKCYKWTGSQNNYNNYVQATIYIGKMEYAYRLLYIMTKGIPGDTTDHNDNCPCGEKNKKGERKRYGSCCKLMMRHHCASITGGNLKGLCVNPLHLSLGTSEENQRDIRVHGTGKGGLFLGEQHYEATMTDEKAREVWADIQEGKLSLRDVSNKHRISYNAVKDMNRGKSWKHITGIDGSKFKNQRVDREEIRYKDKINKRKNIDIPEKTEVKIKKSQKLTDEIAQQIIKESKSKEPKLVKKLTEKYNVGETTIRDLLKGRTFKHLNRD